jgi:hypothetical protein
MAGSVAFPIFPLMPISVGVAPLLLIAVGLPLLALLFHRRVPTFGLWLRTAVARREHGHRPPDMARAAAYHRCLAMPDRAAALDDRTWKDLDLDEVFCALDQTASEPGRQYLYHLLRTPAFRSAPLEQRERLLARWASDETLTARVRGLLSRLQHPRAGELVQLVFGALPARPSYWFLFPALTVASLTCLALVTVWPAAFAVWLVVCLLNLWVQLAYKPRVKRFVPAIRELPAFVGVGSALGALDIPEAPQETAALREGSRTLRSLRHAAKWLVFEPEGGNDLVASIYEYVNLLFLLDVNAFVFTIEKLRNSQSAMQQVFETLGYLDATQSVSRWRDGLPRWTTPQFVSEGKVLDVEGLRHPLLTDPVPNSLHVENASVLITGSNMSGKTTFVRAMGVNAILAQALHTVCAAKWRAPMVRVRTSIGRADSIVDGKSYYLAEVEAVAALVHAKSDDAPCLFLLDEIFRGTNTTERVAAGFAVLSYLGRGADIVIVATHDIELIDLLGDRYVTKHFREQVAGGQMMFDYRIHDGPTAGRNAIALLEMVKLPAELVAEAVATMDWQSRPRPDLAPLGDMS